MLLLYPPHCNLNPRFAALVTLHIEKLISLFLPTVHFWNRNFSKQVGEGRVLGSGPWSECSFCAHCRMQPWTPVGFGLTPCDSSMAAIRLIAAFWNCEVRSKHTTIFSLQSQFSALIFVPQLHDSGAWDWHCGVSRWSEPCFTARHPLQLTVKSKVR